MAKHKYKRIACNIEDATVFQPWQADMLSIDAKVDAAYNTFKNEFELLAVDIFAALFPLGYDVIERYRNGTSTLIYVDKEKTGIEIHFKFAGKYNFIGGLGWRSGAYSDSASTRMSIHLPAMKPYTWYNGWDGGRIDSNRNNTDYTKSVYVLHDPKIAVNSVITAYTTYRSAITKLFDSRFKLGGLPPAPAILS